MTTSCQMPPDPAVFIHKLHTITKQQPNTRGSSAFTDGVRWQMNLSYVSEKDVGQYKISAAEKRFFLMATVVKNNYGPPSEALLLHREDDGYLIPSDRTADPEGDEARLLERVRKIVLMDGLASTTYSKSSFVNKFCGKDSPLKLGVGNNAFRKLMQKWIGEGKLSVDDAKKLKV